MDIYIKPKSKAVIKGRKAAYLKDVAQAYVSGDGNRDIENILLLTTNENKPVLLSAIDIVRKINAKYPNATVSNLGETDTVVEFIAESKPEPFYIKWFKICSAAAILFAGSATAIMSFHADAEMTKIFQNYYYIFFGKNTDTPYIIAIPYSIGLAAGIIAFFNHFSKIYITKDPTPIEVQMTTYESETNDCVIDNLSDDGGKNG